MARHGLRSHRAKRFTSIFGVALLSAALLPAVAGAATSSWASAEPMGDARSSHSATVLQNGQVLVAGGANDFVAFLSSAELYDPATDSWSSAGAMAEARRQHSATLLQNGKVLVAGGGIDQFGTAISSAELYDPASNSWSSAGAMTQARVSHTATLLQNGKVLIAGGYAGFGDLLTTAELYDPATNSWSIAGGLIEHRDLHSATLLQNGKVLIAGGFGGEAEHTISSAELYDPATDSWSSTGPMAQDRDLHTATLLLNGKVLVAGGRTDTDAFFAGTVTSLSSAELYDPATGSWSSAGAMTEARSDYPTTLLPNGKVLVAGGAGEYDGYNGQPINGAELYDPVSDSWSSAGPMTDARFEFTATLLSSGDVLVAGGSNPAGVLSSVELFDPDAVPAEESATESTFTFKMTKRVFTGTIQLDADHPGCRAGRDVRLKKIRSGKDALIGADTSGDSGKWSVKIGSHTKGAFYAVVTEEVIPAGAGPEVICSSFRTKTIKIDPA